MKKQILFIVLIFILILGAYFIFNLTSDKGSSKSSYQIASEKIEKGNLWVIDNNYSEHCIAPYRYFDRGCYYSEERKQPMDIIITGDLQNQNLSHSEIVDLCQKMVHKGSVAYCLKSNDEIDLCLQIAGNNEYLQTICNMADDKIIYVEWQQGQSYCQNNKCFPFMSYSDFD